MYVVRNHDHTEKTQALSLNALWDESNRQYSRIRTPPTVRVVLAVLDTDGKKERQSVKQRTKLSMTASVTFKSRIKIKYTISNVNFTINVD